MIHLRTFPMKWRGERRIGRTAATVGTKCGAYPTSEDVRIRDTVGIRRWAAEQGKELCPKCFPEYEGGVA